MNENDIIDDRQWVKYGNKFSGKVTDQQEVNLSANLSVDSCVHPAPKSALESYGQSMPADENKRQLHLFILQDSKSSSSLTW